MFCRRLQGATNQWFPGLLSGSSVPGAGLICGPCRKAEVDNGACVPTWREHCLTFETARFAVLDLGARDIWDVGSAN